MTAILEARGFAAAHEEWTSLTDKTAVRKTPAMMRYLEVIEPLLLSDDEDEANG